MKNAISRLLDKFGYIVLTKRKVSTYKKAELEKLDKFDLICMQYVFGLFAPEAGRTVLENCARLLNRDGYFLISTPDLRKYIGFYPNRTIRKNI